MPLDTDRPMMTRRMENAVLLPQIFQMLEEGHTVTLPLRGRSMRPFLENGRDKALLVKPDRNPCIGEPVLAEIRPKTYVLHRIVSIEGQDITLLGDGNLSPEHCQIADVRALVVGFYRKGRTKLDAVNGRKWRIYSWLWTRLLPIRRYLLFALHPHIPNRLKKMIKQ